MWVCYRHLSGLPSLVPKLRLGNPRLASSGWPRPSQVLERTAAGSWSFQDFSSQAQLGNQGNQDKG